MKLFKSGRNKPEARTVAPAAASDPLLHFAAEPSGSASAGTGAPPKSGRRLFRTAPLLGATALVAAAGVAVGLVWWDRLDAAEPRLGHVTVETTPAGATVTIDGQTRGASPVTVSLAPGPHLAIVRRDGDERTIPFTTSAGADLVEHVELTAAITPAPPAVGSLSVTSDPAGAKVQIDGKPRGATPLVLSDLPPSEYRVVIATADATAERKVKITPGATTSVVVSLARTPSGPAAGWVTIAAPFDLSVAEGDAVVGGGKNLKIMLPAGHHALALANTALGYRDNRTVDVTAGGTASIKVTPPSVAVNVNARPWADVIVSGKTVGQTPIANLQMPIGTYEMLFRHPQLGERTATINVTSNGPNRISMDMTKP